jgi:TolB-like protein
MVATARDDRGLTMCAAASRPVQAESEHVSAEACRDALRRILDSRDFDGSDRERQFLVYVCEEALAGRAERIKAFTVAVEVFGRNASFDPQNDPIVRVQAGHLRRTLERYYLGAGCNDPIRLTIPKGAYVPLFERAQESAPAPLAAVAPAQVPTDAVVPVRSNATHRRRWVAAAVAALALTLLSAAALGLRSRLTPTIQSAGPAIPRLFVRPLEGAGGDATTVEIARGLTQEIAAQVSKFRDTVVIEASSDRPLDTDEGAARYTLAGSVALSGNSFRLQTRLLDRESRAILWAATYVHELDVGKLLEAQSDIARQVATALGQPYGAIFQADTSRRIESPPDDWEAYACTLRYYAYRANLDPTTYPSVRKCLERATERFPAYATAWALLSQIYIDEIRFRYPAAENSAPGSALDRALASARRAVQLDPFNVRGLQAEMFALYFNGDVDAALKVGAEALAINPNDTELAGEYGYRLALSGQWERGCPLVRTARERNPGPLAYYESALALCAYMQGDFASAISWIRKTQAAENPNYHLIAAIIYGEAGAPEVAVEREWLGAHAPKLIGNLRAEISQRVRRTEDVERFLGSLRKAGLTSDP